MSDFADIFSAGGPLARALEGFRERPSQQRMATRISEALAAREALLVEAGTGTGKTFAYLVPALLSGLRVLISTGTRTLQDQLYHRDLPLLAAALGRPARVALLKGRGNYLCRARLESIGRQGDLLPAAGDPLLGRITDWSLATRSGDLAELPELADAHPLRPHITSTRENCLGSRCGHYSQCHVLEARRTALEADIVVVNHHLLLADLALKEDGFGDLLPSVDAVILDEAHQLPDLVSEFFGVSFASRQIEVLAADLRAQIKLAGLDAAIIEPLERALGECVVAFGREERQLAWRELADSVRSCLEDLEEALAQLLEQLRPLNSERGFESFEPRTAELLGALSQLLDGSRVHESQVDEARVDGARTATIHARGFQLRLLPYDVSTRFNALLTANHSAWIFTSATLAVREDFGHFAARLGLQAAATVCYESPFDYARQALLFLPGGLPEPASPGYTAAVVAAARPLIEASGGGAFLLFTSHRALRTAAAILERLLPAHWPLLVQGRAPREQLLRRFRASGRAVLLGTSSFWEGVDVQGFALRLVLIDRLPFASPEDPVVRARIEHLESQGGNAFRDYQLPEAVLTLKQGVGRLIRSEDDRGVVVICDPRLRGRSYGRVFLSSLPPMAHATDLDSALRLLRDLGKDVPMGTAGAIDGPVPVGAGVKILALDTATELCSAALYIDGRCRVREDARPRGSGELILGMISELLAEAQLALGQLDAVAFGRGPGGFTGVRLAVVVAQGLGFAAGLPLLPVSDLRALARQALLQPGAPPRVLVCQDARMAQVYWGCYQGSGSATEALDFPAAVRLPPEWDGVPVCGAGSGFEAYAAALRELPGAALTPLFGHLRPRAREIAELAAIDGLADAVAPEGAQPVYLRDEVAALPAQN